MTAAITRRAALLVILSAAFTAALSLAYARFEELGEDDHSRGER